MVLRRSTKPVRNKRLPVKKRAAPEVTSRASAFSSVDWGRLRLWCVGGLFCLMWIGLWGRAFYLQIVEGPELAAKSKIPP